MKLISGAQKSSSGKLRAIDREKSNLSLLVEEDRKRKEQQKRSGIIETSNQESLRQTQEQAGLREENRGGFASFFLGGAKDLARLATRGKQDEDYLRQIEQNNKTVAEILKAKKARPEKEGEYNLMLETLLKKNEALTGATGGNTKDLSTAQMFGKSVRAVTEMIPTLGGGVTAAGAAARNVGGRTLLTSLAKEGGAFGLIAGGGEVLEKKQTKPAEIFGTVATNAIISTVANTAIGGLSFSASKWLTEKLGNYFAGEKVNFTPKEKDFLEENVPEFSDEELFRQAGLESPIEKTDTDLTAKTIAAADDEDTIKSILSGKVSEEDSDFLSKSLKNITDPDEVASILDEYDPAKVKANIAEKISMLDNEKRIGSLLKDTVSESDIPKVSKLLKNMENEDEIVKVLDEFESKKLSDDAAKVAEETVVQTPEVKVDEPPVEKKFVERDMTDTELADALMKKERSMFKEDNPRFQANSKAAGMKYSSIKKRLNGDATQKEIKAARKYLESGYNGKEVKVGGNKGIIKKTAYGKYGIDFGDGKIKFHTADEIRAKKVTDKQVIQHIIDGAKKELENSSKIFKSVSRKISEEVLPKPKAETPKPKPVEKASEPVKETKKETPKAKAEEPKAKEEPKKESPASGEASSLPSSGKNKTSKLSKSTLRKALENNMIRETLDLPTTERTSFKIQDEKAIDLVIKNTDEAIDIALGFKEPPRDILFGRIYGAVEKYAIANKDFDLLAKLTTSKKSAEFATRAGQEVKALDNSVLGNPRAISQEILKLKEEILKKNKINPDKELKNTLQEINKFIDNSSSTEKDLDDLIKSIKC